MCNRVVPSLIRTYTGRLVDPLNLRVEDIDIQDIAHALSNICRFTGHVRSFYSVAQHSVYIARRMPLDVMLWGLLHDASEAYLTDISKPLKQTPDFTAYRDAERRAMATICDAFRIRRTEPECVKTADKIMLHTEQRDLMTGAEYDWELVYPFTIIPVGPEAAKSLFLMSYQEALPYAH